MPAAVPPARFLEAAAARAAKPPREENVSVDVEGPLSTASKPATSASPSSSASQYEAAAEGGQVESEATPLRGLKEPACSWRSAADIAFAVLGIVILTVLINRLAGKYVEAYSQRFIRSCGLEGLFVMVFIIECVAFPWPVPYFALVYVGLAGGLPPGAVFLACGSASYLAALIGYCIGALIRSCWPTVADWLDRLSARHPQTAQLMLERGALGVAFATLLPVPLYAVSWTAGSFKVPFPWYSLAALNRVLKVAILVVLCNALRSNAGAGGGEGIAAAFMRKVAQR